MWEHALGIRLCHCFTVGVCHLPVPDITASDTHLQEKHWHNVIPNACSNISYIGVHVMVHSVTLARTDILPEDGHTVTETCRRFYEILAL